MLCLQHQWKAAIEPCARGNIAAADRRPIEHDQLVYSLANTLGLFGWMLASRGLSADATSALLAELDLLEIIENASHYDTPAREEAALTRPLH